MTEKLNKAEDLLKEAYDTLVERGKLHDKAGEQERSLGKVAEMMSILKGREFTAEDIGLVQICVKLVRSQQGNYHHDNFVDLAGYAALTGEEAHRLKLGADALKTTAIASGASGVADTPVRNYNIIERDYEGGGLLRADMEVAKENYNGVFALRIALGEGALTDWQGVLEKISISQIPNPNGESVRVILSTAKGKLNGASDHSIFLSLASYAADILKATAPVE